MLRIERQWPARAGVNGLCAARVLVLWMFGIEVEAGRRQRSTPPPGPLCPRPWVLGYAGHGADDRRAAKVNG